MASKGKGSQEKYFILPNWIWEVEQPFSLAQVDTKDILDKGTLGTTL